MSFANPWGLFGLLAVPAVLFFHWYQRRFPRMAVAGLHLWGVRIDSRDAGPKRERLPITSSLLLELLVAIVLTLILAQPRIDATARAEHLVVVLDDSASMSATPKGELAPREAALQQLEERITALPENSVVTILLSGRNVATLAGPEAKQEEAIAALAKWKPRKPRHSFSPAWDQASQIAGETGRMLFITDRIPVDGNGKLTEPVPSRMELISVGHSAGNVGFTRARWTISPVYAKNGKRVVGIIGRVFAWVQNFGRNPETVTVAAKNQAGKSVFTKTQLLQPGQGTPIRFKVPGGTGRLELTITAAQDSLTLDNKVILLEPKLRTVKIAVALKAGSVARSQVEKALRLIPGIELVKPDSADLAIAPASPLPPSSEELWWLGIGPLKSPNAKQANKKTGIKLAQDSVYIIDRSHPLMAGVQLLGVRWSGVQPFDLQTRPLIVRDGHLLLGQLKGTDTTAFVMNVDLKSSSLVESPDWPILLQNLVELRRKALPGPGEWNYRSGSEISFRLAGDQAEGDVPLKLSFGDATRDIARTDPVRFFAPDQPGVYELRDGEKSLDRFAVAFGDSRESDLSQLKSEQFKPQGADDESGFFIDKPLSPLVISLIVVALAALCLDWFVLRPKRRV